MQKLSLIKHLSIVAIILLTCVYVMGCATISGPTVSDSEIETAKEELMVKALNYQLTQLERVSTIGYRLIKSLPRTESQKTYPYVGIIAASIDKYSRRLFSLNTDRGIIILSVIKNSPAEISSLQKGDIIQSVNNRSFSNNNAGFVNYLGHLPLDRPAHFLVLRGDRNIRISLMPEAMPISVHFQMIDIPEANAAATSDNQILYTYGMVKFADSDDEIAVVLAHELAHLVRGHVIKMQGAEVLNQLLSLALGSIAESRSPGSGPVVRQGTQDISTLFTRKYSRDLENEADYFGMKYVYGAGYNIKAGVKVWERFAIELPQSMISSYLATHPSSPERMIRIQRIIQELEKTGIKK